VVQRRAEHLPRERLELLGRALSTNRPRIPRSSAASVSPARPEPPQDVDAALRGGVRRAEVRRGPRDRADPGRDAHARRGLRHPRRHAATRRRTRASASAAPRRGHRAVTTSPDRR
jgi:hypothetical protein